MSENFGIAHAPNLGIQKALEHQVEYIILSDKDTLYPEGFVQKMLPVFTENNNSIAAVAPLFYYVVGNNKNEGFIFLSKLRYSFIFPNNGHYEINQAIVSGLIISLPRAIAHRIGNNLVGYCGLKSSLR